MDKKVGFWNIANLFSLSRIPLGIICAFLILYKMYYPAVALGIIAVATDYLDGYFAKKKGLKTKLGAILDPATDKVFVILVLAALVVDFRIALWKVAAILSREIIEVFAAGIMFAVGYKPKGELKAGFAGKIVTCLQFIALLFIILSLPYQNLLIYVLLVMTAIALLQYAVTHLKSK